MSCCQLDLVACILQRSGEPSDLVQIGHLMPGTRKGQAWEFIGPVPVNELDLNFTEFITALEAEFVKERGTHYLTYAAGQEECVLVIVVLPRKTKHIEERVAELKDLSYSAGLSVLDVVVQRPKSCTRSSSWEKERSKRLPWDAASWEQICSSLTRS